MIFFPKHDALPEIIIKFNGKSIFPSKSGKYLGIYLEENLMESNTLKPYKQLNKSNGMLSKSRHHIHQHQLKIVYYATFSSHVTYACQVWTQKRNTATQIFQLFKKKQSTNNDFFPL